jgi:peptidyl-prolyl cis-trans isomerase SurA
MRRFVLLAALLLAAVPGFAQETRIAAVVNDDVISVPDLRSRMQLILVSSNLQDSPQTRQRLAPQVLRALVDEKLEMQEAKRLNIKVSDRELDEALERIEAQNRLPKGGLDRFLSERGVDRSSLTEQLTATIAWAKVVRRKFGQSGGVSEEEIDEAIARLKDMDGQQQARIAEIFLSVDTPQQEDEVKRAAERLFEQIGAGAKFPSVAQQFSQSATAAVGGDIGWVNPNQLGTEIAAAVERMKPGELSPPVRAAGGYYLLLLIDRRTVTAGSPVDAVVGLSQVMFPVPPNASEAETQKARQAAQAVADEAKSCGEMARIGRERAPKTSGDLGRVRVGDLPQELRPVVAALPVAQPSSPVPLRGGVGVLMVCSRDGGPGGPPARDEIAEGIARQKLENTARRYLRDLRRLAYVDVRV